MNPEQKIITFDQAKKIAELIKERGIELPRSQYYWMKDEYTENPTLVDTKLLKDMCYDFYPAYNIAEMMEIMKGLPIALYDNYHAALYENHLMNDIERAILISNSHAEALGELLIYLVENNKL
jgi:hypothetical protein